ncbi:MAG: bifunctional phosphopantothenoylcysteine decarboxylase/phosphopantothenate--cysteine ligase CoaBC [Nitrospira bacterium HGW-Nitrospira-1]|nr:MAG: bifunctional phosphopantothenoylcysteine decarboxylase/phosphopantothenate--cysteine ligase CoaBC [Nitrospira bacterium HGW-Nitrospira-1]
MQGKLKDKSILLGVTGGVAAYKAVELVRRLKDEGASVTVIMTKAAGHFITPLSLEVASQNIVYTSLFDTPMAHIALPAKADVMVIAPATANIIAKFAHGIADDLLSACFLSYQGRIVVAPSMNWKMYENQIVQENLRKLKSRGVIQVGPEKGRLACGEEGLGRLSDVQDIAEAVGAAITGKDLSNEKIVVTAGPTREYIDPVRFISNRSSGRMGYALARAARDRGAAVTLISGPSSLERPCGLKFVQVETSEEMLEAVAKETGEDTTVLIMSAAVADFKPQERSASKIEKSEGMTLKLHKADDIISHITGRDKRPFVIGFAAETGGNIDRAEKKMLQKNMDMIVFNDVSEPGAGFEVDTNRVVIIDRRGKTVTELLSKDSIADIVLDRFVENKPCGG